MKVALSTYPGSFRIPKKARLWLLRSRRAFSIFNSVPIEESNFVLSNVQSFIEDEDADFAGHYGEEWAYYNDSIVCKTDWTFWELKFVLKSGERYRGHLDLIKAIEKFQPDDIEIVETDPDFDIKTNSEGEYILMNSEISP